MNTGGAIVNRGEIVSMYAGLKTKSQYKENRRGENSRFS